MITRARPHPATPMAARSGITCRVSDACLFQVSHCCQACLDLRFAKLEVRTCRTGLFYTEIRECLFAVTATLQPTFRAALAVEQRVDGIIVSNHGGRAEESGRATIDSLREVVDGVAGRIPVLVDGGFRRGTDIFKALALGANAVCIGRPYVWGQPRSGNQALRRCSRFSVAN